jgi:hypothetical protein
MREVCEHYGLPYTGGPLYGQYAQVLTRSCAKRSPAGDRRTHPSGARWTRRCQRPASGG